VVDSDSDNDGIIDGRDPFPWKPPHHRRPVRRAMRALGLLLGLLGIGALLLARRAARFWLAVGAVAAFTLVFVLAWLFCLDLFVWPAFLLLLAAILLTLLFWDQLHPRLG